ncbi:MAG: hypothetical protein R6V85_01535 [Polyangia bacterium]
MRAVAGAAGLAAVGCGEKRSEAGGRKLEGEPRPEQWWVEGRWVSHEAVLTDRLDQGVIRARAGGEWRDFEIAALPDRFVEWSLRERVRRLEKLAEVGFDPRDLDGPHNACVATWGGWRRDSAISLNTAYKGMGFVPRDELLDEALAELESAHADIERRAGRDFRASMRLKTVHLAELYHSTELWDRTKQASLELFTTPRWATHTFLNMMANPVASASFLAYPTFELRAVPQLLHTRDPGLSERERGLTRWVNAIHDFVHGGSGDRIACVYHVIEVFDDTPNQRGRGRRIV